MLTPDAIDTLWHVLETLGSTAIVAAIAYGRISTKMESFEKRMDSADLSRESMSRRIDDIFTRL